MHKFTAGNHQHGITDPPHCDHPRTGLQFPFKASFWHDPCQEESGGEDPDQDAGVLSPQQGEGAAGEDGAVGDSPLHPEQPDLSRDDQQVPWILILPENVDGGCQYYSIQAGLEFIYTTYFIFIWFLEIIESTHL